MEGKYNLKFGVGKGYKLSPEKDQKTAIPHNTVPTSHLWIAKQVLSLTGF
jgi:hypothetical protein